MSEDQTNHPIEVKSKNNSFFREIITFLIIAVFVVLPFRMFVAEPYLVSGSSMYPTFSTGNYLIVDKVSYKMHNPSRFDVIVMIYPADPSKDFLKRIIGLPNETVIIENGSVSIKKQNEENGVKLDEQYVQLPKSENLTKVLGPNEYFVMGDNRAGSFDSRYWGPLPKEDIVGKPLIRLWPFSKIGFYPGKAY